MFWRWNNIGITHGFSCINICRVPGKRFEHEATRSSVQIFSEGPGKCYCNEITIDDRCSCITYDSKGKLWRKGPKAPYKHQLHSSNVTQTNTASSSECCLPWCQLRNDPLTSSKNSKMLRSGRVRFVAQRNINKARPILWYQKFKIHVQTAREFHDLNMGFVVWTRLLVHSRIASNSYVHRILCKNVESNG